MRNDRTLRWLVTALLCWRSAVAPVALVGGSRLLGNTGRTYLPIMAFVILINLIVIAMVNVNRFSSRITSPSFVLADSLFTATLSVVTVALLPDGTYLMPYRDTFWLYAAGSVGLGTVVCGLRTGLGLLGMGFLLQAGLAWLNHAAFNVTGWLVMIARLGWLVNGLVMPLVISRLAHVGTRIADLEGKRAGEALERAYRLREVHDTLLQTLSKISTWCVAEQIAPSERLSNIREMAVAELTQFHRTIDDRRPTDSGLSEALQRLADEFRGEGLTVDVDTSELTSAPDSPKTVEALSKVVGELLTNISKHAGVDRAQVRAQDAKDGLEIVVEDGGCGFDPLALTDGFGLANSVQGRIHELDGQVEIFSAPSQGSLVRLLVPLHAGTGTDVDAITRRALEWSVIAALAYRVALGPLQIAGAVAYVGVDLPRPFWLAISAVLSADMFVLIGIVTGRLSGILRSRIFFVVDVAIAAALNVWASALLPHATVAIPGRELLWGYELGVVIFWTILRGPGVGAGIVLAGAVLQWIMLAVNGAVLTRDGFIQLASRQGFLTLAYGMACLLVWLARRSSRIAAEEGHRAGEAIERVRHLQTLQDSVLQTFQGIAERAVPSRHPEQNSLLEIRGMALRQITELRHGLLHTDGREGVLLGELRSAAEEFRGLGLRVELVTTELTAEPDQQARNVLIAAVKEALANVLACAGVAHAVLRAADQDGGVAIVIRDHGRGDDPVARGFDLRIVRPVEESGGTAEVSASPGLGTRVRVWMPKEITDRQ